ncbi:hypothetical protein [Streptomyces sp. PvR034]|uniref:hypothetical protein n=1 Tax=Streptomyces sp. PvR034 TaxID=3156401 RepID=UPI00339A19D0
MIAGAARGGSGGGIGSTSTGQIAVGGALVAGALGAGFPVMRRRAEADAARDGRWSRRLGTFPPPAPHRAPQG